MPPSIAIGSIHGLSRCLIKAEFIVSGILCKINEFFLSLHPVNEVIEYG